MRVLTVARVLMIALLTLGGGCVFSPTIGDGTIACSSEGACPPGFSCHGGSCLRMAPGVGSGGGDDMGGSDDMSESCDPLICVPNSSCGMMPDGCGHMLPCGDCASGQMCSDDNQCHCKPKAACAPVQCGKLDDGCGGVINCPLICKPGETCGAGGAANRCGVGTCQKIEKCPDGKNCGSISDECGGTVPCGNCTTPETCSGSGTANVCGCTKLDTCAQARANCGIALDGCGGKLDCGKCKNDKMTCGGEGPMGKGKPNQCRAGSCMPKTCAEQGKNCGLISNGCDDVIDCGSCFNGQRCGGGGVANVCG